MLDTTGIRYTSMVKSPVWEMYGFVLYVGARLQNKEGKSWVCYFAVNKIRSLPYN
jgi:hypothetical protein